MSTRIFPNWQELYAQQPIETMPWYYPDLDPDLDQALTAQGITSGAILDLGTGPATQAFALAQRGFQVTATDLSKDAIELGRAASAQKNLSIHFVQDDVLNSKLTESFDVVFDRGCFHVFAPELRPVYATQLAKLVRPGGYFFLKCFSDEQPGEIGPYQSTASDPKTTFQSAFDLVSILRTIYQGTLAEKPKAFFCTFRRKV
jgi:2-polyprenyl-3-methyl-5-hydroxy-6-metoxy-1,4-benzoquinol methylase